MGAETASYVIRNSCGVKSHVRRLQRPWSHVRIGNRYTSREQAVDVSFEVVSQPQHAALPTGNGGGSKPASEKQMKLISDLAGKNGKSVEELSGQMFGKSSDQLYGSEANELIRSFQQ